MRTCPLLEETGLPILTTGSKSLGWLGMMFLLAVLGWGLSTLIYSYFYLRLYSNEWPQDSLPPPELLLPGLTYALLPAAAGAMAWAWSSLRRGKRLGYRLGLTAGCVLAVFFVGLHLYEFSRLPFAPQTNAYGSIFYMLSWGVDTAALVGLGMGGVALVRAWRPDDHWQILQALHAQMTAHFWYFTAVAGALIYGTLYLSPYLL